MSVAAWSQIEYRLMAEIMPCRYADQNTPAANDTRDSDRESEAAPP